MTDFEDRYYSMPEICKYLGIGRDSALKWIANKGMPAYKVGKKWKFKLSEIDACVSNGQAEE
ncbi:MAG: helix-turn-helix domain-containing protein [Clostridia bacterium]|nr:helix-turn-helix domain-containing protein [Clostridia bacterium]